VARKPEESSKFDQFVREFGVEELAQRLAINPSAIYHWLRGSTSPHPANAIKIQTLAKQRGVTLSLDEIYQHFREVRSERYLPSSLKPQPARV
jgi:transcriptional regulator with XRE-family HTH domain